MNRLRLRLASVRAGPYAGGLTYAPVVARSMSGTSSALNASKSNTPNTSNTSNAPASTPPKPKRINPYRLPSLPTFLGSFAPLHAAGWRLDVIPQDAQTPAPTPGSPGTTSHNAAVDVLSGADLQGRCLTRAYAFPASREGWRALIGLFARVSEAVEVEDHHPSLTVAPFADLPSAMREIVETEEAGYVLHVSMHTHTPMPPLGAEFEGKPAPGVTHKDLKLAERIEALAGEV